MSRITIGAFAGSVFALVAAVLVLVVPATAAKGIRTSVAVRHSNLGRILVDGHGRTLYLFEKDKHGKSSCYGACASEWPPLIASGKTRARAGARASLLGRTKRMDGRSQVTYRRHPLYTFVGDSKKGQTTGEGLNFFGGKWFAVSPAGVKIVKSGSTGSSGGSPYPGY